MHSLIVSATTEELNFIAGLDYGIGQDSHYAELVDLIFKRNGVFHENNTWFPYEVIELGANYAQIGHEREFVICSLLVIHAVQTGFDTWSLIEERFTRSVDAFSKISSELSNVLLNEYIIAIA